MIVNVLNKGKIYRIEKVYDINISVKLDKDNEEQFTITRITYYEGEPIGDKDNIMIEQSDIKEIKLIIDSNQPTSQLTK